MRRPHRFLWPVCLLLWQACPALAQEKKQEPVTQVGGHKLEYWIKEIGSNDQSKSENAIRMVLQFGPDRAYQAVPAISARLRSHQTRRVDTSVLANGILVLGAILTNTKEASHKDIKEAVTLLRRFLTDRESIVKLRAAQALTNFGADAKDAVPELINLTSDEGTFENRQAAVVALGRVAYDNVKGPSPAVLSALYGRLSTEKALTVRLAAIQSLTALGGPADPTMRSGLIRALDPVAYKDTEPGLRIWAHMAVMSIKNNIDKDRVEAIADMLGNPDVAARVQAAQALGTIGKDAKQTIPRLMKSLNDPEETAVTWSIWALGRMGPSAGAALPALQRIKSDMTLPELHRKLAEETIDQINGKNINEKK